MGSNPIARSKQSLLGWTSPVTLLIPRSPDRESLYRSFVVVASGWSPLVNPDPYQRANLESLSLFLAAGSTLLVVFFYFLGRTAGPLGEASTWSLSHCFTRPDEALPGSVLFKPHCAA